MEALVRVAFLGSKAIGAFCLEHMLTGPQSQAVDVVAVLSNDRKLSGDEPGVLNVANQHRLTVVDSEEALRDIEFDILLSVQYHAILKKTILDLAKRYAVNLHMAPVPEYRGANQFSFAIIDRSPLFGTTLHIMSEGIDSGDILFENRFPINPDTETAKSLYEKTLEASKILFVDSWSAVVSGAVEPVPQRSLTDRKSGFHLKSEINDIKVVDMAWSEEQRDRHVRACWFPPFPPPYTVVNGRKIELTLNRAEDPKA